MAAGHERGHETVSAWNKPAGSDDDSHDSDECLTPIASGSLHKMYSLDRPGFRSMTTSSYNALLQKINFVEFVRIRRADGSTYDSPRQQHWHTVLMLERNSGTWSVTRASSEIDTGHLSVSIHESGSTGRPGRRGALTNERGARCTRT